MKKILFSALFVMIALQTIAQGIFLRKNMDYYFQIERLDILSGTISDTLHTALNGMTNKDVTQYLENYLNQNQESEASLELWNLDQIPKIIAKSDIKLLQNFSP